jgi:hypothetical protein
MLFRADGKSFLFGTSSEITRPIPAAALRRRAQLTLAAGGLDLEA